MVRLPDLIFVVDVRREDTAIHEANLLSIPVVAMVDTNCDPSKVDYVIPSNDDAIRAIKLMVATIADAVVEGRALRKDDDPMEVGTRAAEQPGPRTSEGMRTIIDEDGEDELTDEQLLGAATLAKLAPDEVEAIPVAEVVAEGEVEEPVEVEVEEPVEVEVEEAEVEVEEVEVEEGEVEEAGDKNVAAEAAGDDEPDSDDESDGDQSESDDQPDKVDEA
jgi:small subunit ribosomal protein S2